MKRIIGKNKGKINLQDRANLSGVKAKTVKVYKIKKAKVVKLSNRMIEEKALALRKLEMEYKKKKDEILNQKWMVINDKIVKQK